MLTLDSFGRQVRRLRTEKGLSQQQLADLMFVTRKTIGNWESGGRLPDISLLSRLARVLGVETSVLLDAMYGPDSPPNLLAVADDSAQLGVLLRTIRAALPHTQVFGFRDALETLSFAAGTPVAAALVDTAFCGERGLELAKQLQKLDARTNIILLSDGPRFAVDAWGIHASGFVLGPLTDEKLRREIACLRYPVQGLSL